MEVRYRRTGSNVTAPSYFVPQSQIKQDHLVNSKSPQEYAQCTGKQKGNNTKQEATQ